MSNTAIKMSSMRFNRTDPFYNKLKQPAEKSSAPRISPTIIVELG